MRRPFAFSIVVATTAAAAVIVSGGCSRSSGPVSGVDPDKAATMNQERSAFERAEDPPIRAETYFAAGQLAESNGDLAAAAWQYGEAIRLDPKHKRALYRQGICLSQLKKFPEAV